MLTVCLGKSNPFPAAGPVRAKHFFVYDLNFPKTLHLNASSLLRLFPDELKFIVEYICLIGKFVGSALFLLGVSYTIKTES